MVLGIVGKDTQFLLDIDRRITELLPYRNPVSLLGEFTVQGDSAEIVADGGNLVFASAEGIYVTLTTNAVTNNEAYVDGNRQYSRQKEPAFHCRFRLNHSSFVRMFIGLTSEATLSVLSSSLPTGSYAGLYVNTGDDLSFSSIRGSGGSPVKEIGEFGALDTGIHDFYMWVKKSGGHDEVSMQLDDGDMVVYTTTLPSAADIMRYIVGVSTRQSSAKSIDIFKTSINQEV